MDSILRSDIRQLMFDAEKVQKNLEILERDDAAWARKPQRGDLTQLIEDVKRLEFDLSTILTDCLSLGRQYWKEHKLAVVDSLHQSFDTMNTLFNDLKKLGMAQSEPHINPSDLQQLVIDWGRFEKSIYQIQKAMQHPQQRRKNHAWARHGSLKPEGAW